MSFDPFAHAYVESGESGSLVFSETPLPFESLFTPAAKLLPAQSMPAATIPNIIRGATASSTVPAQCTSSPTTRKRRLYPDFRRIPSPLNTGVLSVMFCKPEHRVVFVNITKSPLSTVQVLRLLYFAGAGAWLVGESDCLVMVVYCTDAARRSVAMWLETEAVHRYHIHACLSPESMLTLDNMSIACVLRCSLMFELNRSHGWISIGSDGSSMSISDILTTPVQPCDKPHRNIPVMTVQPSCNVDESVGIDVTLRVHKYHPLSLSDLTHIRHPINVTVLPGLSQGEASVGTYSTGQLRDYWFTHHGYMLGNDPTTVNVTFSGSEGDFSYPLACVWKHCWSYLPTHTNEYRAPMHERFHRELAAVVTTWRSASGLDVQYQTQ